MRSIGGRALSNRRTADTASAIASTLSHRLTQRAFRRRWVSEPVFAVLRNTPSRRAIPSTQPRAVIQLADKLMTKARRALRREIDFQCRSAHIMQIVAMMMRDMGNSVLSPASGMRAKLDPESSNPVITSRSRENAAIKRSRNQLKHAIR